jgi:L-ascorbate metabolism protein UlaG (beta-lactamase superfamily)
MTYARHSSAIEDSYSVRVVDHAAGYVIDGGTRIYHAGDTGLFSDMKLIGGALPSSGSASAYQRPIHYGSQRGSHSSQLASARDRDTHALQIPGNQLNRSPADFQASVETLCDTEVLVMEAGETVEL